MRLSEVSTGSVGVLLDSRGRLLEDIPEEYHFQVCGICNQPYDRRDLGQVMYHMTEEPDPLEMDS